MNKCVFRMVVDSPLQGKPFSPKSLYHPPPPPTPPHPQFSPVTDYIAVHRASQANCNLYPGVHVAYLFSFLCCVFVCLRPLSCVPNIACVSGLSILCCPFGI